MRIKNTELKIIKADITELSVDAIVNAANNEMRMGGGVAGIIKRKGGVVIEQEALQKAPIAVGESIFTSGGSLKCEYVIHAATMGMDFKTDEIKIRSSCKSALRTAEELKIKRIAFPALGCGVGRFPYLAAAKIMTQEFLKHAKFAGTCLEEVIFCLYSEEAYQIFNTAVTGYISHMQDTLGDGPYVTVDAIIEMPDGIIVIERHNPPFGYALPGGFVDYGESVETAVCREVKEETALDYTDIRIFGVYSDPQRDPRFHTVSTVFIGKGVGMPKSGDDAKSLEVVHWDSLLKKDYAFDHKKIISDYLGQKNK
jgi:O-acetyl-ADP-ribose deacetylase (regulator of RNase III)/ADP-ribose pyrophosphatase YjhB (NUDIX family)